MSFGLRKAIPIQRTTNRVQMSATPSPTQLFLADALSTELSSEEAPYIRPTDPENGEFTNSQPSSDRRTWLTLLGFFIAAGIGTVAGLAWKSYGDAPKATASLKETSPELEAIRQSIDALATGTATNQLQMMLRIDQLAAGLEQMTREITKLQEIGQYALSQNSDHLSQPPLARCESQLCGHRRYRLRSLPPEILEPLDVIDRRPTVPESPRVGPLLTSA